MIRERADRRLGLGMRLTFAGPGGLKSSVLAVCAAASLAGCSGAGSDSSALTTGSIFSSPAKAAVAPALPAAPEVRPTAVAMTSARAARCGFYFDPAKLRQSFLTAQSASGVKPEDLAKVQQTYDGTYARFSKALATDEGFCSEAQVADIKLDLNRHLAGDFTNVQRVSTAPKPMSTWEWLTDGGQKADAGKMDRNEIFFPSGGSQTTTPR